MLYTIAITPVRTVLRKSSYYLFISVFHSLNHLKLIYFGLDSAQVVRVKSTGNDATSPHCSWFTTCEYNEDTKQECAKALCRAQGYSGGSFVEASNNFCTEGISHNGDIWVYALKMSTLYKGKNYAGQILKYNTGNEAIVTADCTRSGMFPLKLCLIHISSQFYSLIKRTMKYCIDL